MEQSKSSTPVYESDSDNGSEGEINIKRPSAGVAGAAGGQAGKAAAPSSDADDESETKGGKKPVKQALVSKTNSSKPRLPTEPFSGLAISTPASPDKKDQKKCAKAPLPNRAKQDFPKTPRSGGKILSDDDVSPKSMSKKPIVQPTPQSCERCGEPGWSSSYCPVCGSGNAFGTLG